MVFTKVEAAEERPNLDKDSDRSPAGDSDRRTFASVLVRDEGFGLVVRMGRLVVEVSGDVTLEGDRVFCTIRGGSGANCDGCWSGSPSFNVVMDCDPSGWRLRLPVGA